MGAWGATLVALTFTELPAYLMIPFMMLAAMTAGALLSGIAGALKRWLNVNEILTSLLLNYVAISFLNYFIFGPWRDPDSFGFPVTAGFVEAARLPRIAGTRVHAFLFLALGLAFLMWILIEKTGWGYEIRAAGESPSAAKYAGIPVERNIVVVFLICGALAGLGGMGEMAGLHYRLREGVVANNFGGYGIIVAWLAGAHPLHIVLVALCAGVLFRGCESLQITMNVSSTMVQILIGTLLASVLIAKFFKDNRLVVR
jgi:simple sugar transport system permease protein